MLPRTPVCWPSGPWTAARITMAPAIPQESHRQLPMHLAQGVTPGSHKGHTGVAQGVTQGSHRGHKQGPRSLTRGHSHRSHTGKCSCFSQGSHRQVPPASHRGPQGSHRGQADKCPCIACRSHITRGPCTSQKSHRGHTRVTQGLHRGHLLEWHKRVTHASLHDVPGTAQGPKWQLCLQCMYQPCMDAFLCRRHPHIWHYSMLL